MSKPKLTPWFPGHIKPVRPGVYEVDGGGWFAYFNGRRFGWQSYDKRRAYLMRNEPTCLSGEQEWRGLAEQPQ